jgi:hypothetical protein
MYYHATFATNYDSIFKHGLMKSAERIWSEISSKHLIYLDDSPISAMDWMISWYEYHLIDKLVPIMVKKRKNYITSKEFDRILNKLPRIHDGVIVLEVDPTGLIIKPRYDRGSFPDGNHPVDYICRKNIPPQNLQVINQVDAPDIIDRFMKNNKNRWVRWGMPE